MRRFIRRNIAATASLGRRRSAGRRRILRCSRMRVRDRIAMPLMMLRVRLRVPERIIVSPFALHVQGLYGEFFLFIFTFSVFILFFAVFINLDL